MSVIAENIGHLLREKENVMRSMKAIAKQRLVLKKIPESEARNLVAADCSFAAASHKDGKECPGCRHPEGSAGPVRQRVPPNQEGQARR